MIDRISAITLATHDMARAVGFYRLLGFEMLHGGAQASFSSFRAGGISQYHRATAIASLDLVGAGDLL